MAADAVEATAWRGRVLSGFTLLWDGRGEYRSEGEAERWAELRLVMMRPVVDPSTSGYRAGIADGPGAGCKVVLLGRPEMPTDFFQTAVEAFLFACRVLGDARACGVLCTARGDVVRGGWGVEIGWSSPLDYWGVKRLVLWADRGANCDSEGEALEYGIEQVALLVPGATKGDSDAGGVWYPTIRHRRLEVYPRVIGGEAWPHSADGESLAYRLACKMIAQAVVIPVEMEVDDG